VLSSMMQFQIIGVMAMSATLGRAVQHMPGGNWGTGKSTRHKLHQLLSGLVVKLYSSEQVDFRRGIK